MLITAVAILLTLVFSLWVSYDIIKDQVMEEIRSYAYLLRDVNANESIAWETFDSIHDEIRITVINRDGSVVFDNYVDKMQMDNHADREEILEAFASGEGFAIRTSNTLSENLFYFAVQMQDGTVVRAAKQASNAWGVLMRLVPLLLCIVMVLFCLCAVLAKISTNKLIAPVENVAEHMDSLEDVEIYEELRPFVAMIQRQHEDILKSATMRQDFTANVSHELKTPLTSISGYAELMENNLVDTKHVTNFARAIHQNADRLLTLINDIIRLSELDGIQTTPEFEDIDIYKIADSCVQMLSVNAANHKVQIILNGNSQIIHANQQMMEELIYNLCDNAIRYNRPDGKVEVDIYQSRRGVVLAVKDTGIGIPKEHQERIFERFYRVDKSRSKETGGTGLGLAIVKHIAAVHDAALELVSEPDVGTQIQVIFKRC